MISSWQLIETKGLERIFPPWQRLGIDQRMSFQTIRQLLLKLLMCLIYQEGAYWCESAFCLWKDCHQHRLLHRMCDMTLGHNPNVLDRTVWHECLGLAIWSLLQAHLLVTQWTSSQRKEHGRHRRHSKILKETSTRQKAQWPLSCLALEVVGWIDSIYQIPMVLSNLVISLCSALGLVPQRSAPKLQIQEHFLA